MTEKGSLRHMACLARPEYAGGTPVTHDLNLVFTLAGGLSAALVLGFITQKLRLSPLVGYLLAGIAVGPHSPGFVADASTASQYAEIGIILLMFGVGLHFHLKDLLAVQAVALPGAIVQIAVSTLLGAAMALPFGWNWQAGAVFGMAVSVASTVVLTRVLTDNRALHTPTGHVALGWLVVEDLFTILALVLLPALLDGTRGDSSLWSALGVITLKLAALVAFTLVVGQKLIPWLLGFVARTGARDLFTLAVLALALGIAVGSAEFFGASMALGAFLAGMVVGQSDFSARAASEALPLRDAFAVLFFVSVGMLLDPGALPEIWPLILVTTALVLLGKPLAALAVVPDRRIFLYSDRAGHKLRHPSPGSHQCRHCRFHHLHHAQSPVVPRHPRSAAPSGEIRHRCGSRRPPCGRKRRAPRARRQTAHRGGWLRPHGPQHLPYSAGQ